MLLVYQIRALINIFKAIAKATEMFEQDVKREDLETYVDKKAVERVKDDLKRGKHDELVMKYNEGRLHMFTVILTQARRARDKAVQEKRKAEAARVADEAANLKFAEAKEQQEKMKEQEEKKKKEQAEASAAQAAAASMVEMSLQQSAKGNTDMDAAPTMTEVKDASQQGPAPSEPDQAPSFAAEKNAPHDEPLAAEDDSALVEAL